MLSLNLFGRYMLFFLFISHEGNQFCLSNLLSFSHPGFLHPGAIGSNCCKFLILLYFSKIALLFFSRQVVLHVGQVKNSL